MVRSFDEHIKRKVVSLDGTWRYLCDEKNLGCDNGWQNGIPDGKTAVVPSVWNTEFGMLGYEGVVWYEKDFSVSGGTLRFVFEGIMTYSKIYLDGELIAEHYGGFDAFDAIVPNVRNGNHKLVIRVDNSFDDNSIPQSFVDWYHYGGIIRSVSLETLSSVSILSAKFQYVLNENMSDAICRLDIGLYNSTQHDKTVPVSVYFDGVKVSETPVTIGGGQILSFRSPEFIVGNVSLWDTDSPKLYEFCVVTDMDDLKDRVGFRRIEAKDGKLLLNGKVVQLRGVNRHEEHPEFGFAFPAALMMRDISIIKDLGCNTIRGSHYPNSKLFIDLLDENGILFWSEIPIWGTGFTAEAIGRKEIVDRGYTMLKSMIDNYYNHPSIILWGMHNEIPSNTNEALAMTEKYFPLLKDQGGPRLVTYATDKPLTDVCLKYCDVISINQYIGWYGGSMDEWPAFLDKFRARRSELGLDNVPVIMSEFGGAAIYGHHTFDNVHWTEEYQAELLSYTLDLFNRDPMIVGTYVWQFTDIRTCLEAGINRARGFNNKGILNEYRKPKQAYFAVKKAYCAFAEEETDA
jgi:beta-glucuronidase